MHRLFLLPIFFLLLFSFSGKTQTYTWNYFQSGNYVVDYDAKHKKLINPSSSLIAFDFEIDTIAEKLMILSSEGVEVYELDGTFDRFISIDFFGDERSIEIDPIRRQIYVTFGTRIFRVNYNGTELTELYNDDTEYIDELAIDPFRNKMYWRTGYTNETIRKANLDGTNVVTIAQAEDIANLEFDAKENKLYFRNYGERRIDLIDLNANSFSTVYSYPNTTDYLSDIFLDTKNQLLYLQTSFPYVIYEFNLLTSEIREIYNFGHRVTTLKSFQGKLFANVDSYKNRRIEVLDLTTKESNIIAERKEYLNVFHVDEPNERWIGTTPFGSVVSTDMFGNIITEFRPEGMNSVIDIQIADDRLIYLDGRRLFSTNFQFEDLKMMTTLEELSPSRITHNPNDNKIYIVSRWRSNIFRCNIDGSEYEGFLELDSLQNLNYPFTDIIFSDYNDKFYLTTREDSLLVQMDEDGSNLITLESGDFNDDLTELALDNSGRYLFYRSAKLREIYQLDVVTKEKIIYASNIPTSISGLFFHPTENTLYALNGSDELIYKFVNGTAEVVFQDNSAIDLGGAFAIDQAGNFYASLFLDYQAIRRFTPSLSSASSQLYRNYRYGREVAYDAEKDELWGMVRPRNSGIYARPFKLNLQTNEMTHYPEVGDHFEVEFVPKHQLIYWVEGAQDRSIVRNNLSTGALDTILYIQENFKRYTSIFYNEVNDRIYFTRADDDVPLQSTDAFGNDLRTENYTQEARTMLAVNATDTTITFLDGLSDDQINRWNFITGEYVSFGSEQEAFYKQSWNLTGTYYDNIDEDNDGFSFIEDCDDTNPAINPDAVEIPDNNIDENCDNIYEFTDEDGDGVPVNFDCNDQDSLINIYALEIPNNDIDENCDDIIEIIDIDNDGYNSDEDCDDYNADINPGATEIPNNYIDEDCDEILAGTDEDGDGFFISDDCDDDNPDVNPNANEIIYNGIDDDCNEFTLDDDLDQDGFVLIDDCDDTNGDVNPAAVEIPYNGIDEDCDPLTYDDDLDQDGFVMTEDCDDMNPEVNADQDEIPYNGMDDDCDPMTPDDDLDGDGFLLVDDCDDENPEVNPDQMEIVGNGIDDDCDDLIDEISSVHELGDYEVSIYPNPADQHIFIESTASNELIVRLYTTTGKLIMPLDGVNQLDVSGVVPGTYLLSLEDNSSGDRVVERIVVMH